MSPSNTDTSGGTRYSEGKPGGWWYAPLGGLELVAPVWEMGADKYAPRDWAQGQLYSTLMNSLSRHIVAMCKRCRVRLLPRSPCLLESTVPTDIHERRTG